MSEQGVPSSVLVGEDHMQVRSALVDVVGGGNEALIWTRIEYRTRHVAHAHEHDGAQWWEVTRAELSRQTGLKPAQVDTAVANLLRRGFLRGEQHSLPMQTMSYSPVIAQSGDLRIGIPGSHDSNPEIPGLQSGDLGSAPSTEESEDVEDPSSSDASGAGSTFSDDVLRLCDLLADLVRANGHKVGTVGKVWWSACDRLIRLDGYTPEQVEIISRWSTSDEFWSANIRSMPTLRKQFSQLRAQRNRQIERKRPSSRDQARTVDERLAARERAQLAIAEVAS